jgi:hypothetical protein
VGFWDRAKSVLGLDKPVSSAPEPAASSRPPTDRSDRRKNKGKRPPLPEVIEGATATIDDALKAREAGSKAEARAILASIDKGQGLRTVLRAAAALEAGDVEELEKLLPAVQKEEPFWQLRLQVAAALDPGPQRDALVREATRLGAPAATLAWVRALSSDEAERRRALVDLLFADPALARTVAARELAVPGVKPDHDAIRRYTAFAHGRDVIQKFGAVHVAALLERAPPATGSASAAGGKKT